MRISSGLKAFVAAGLEIGPDMAAGSKIFTMNALGALVINGDGIAADIEVSASIGGALSDVLQSNARARLLFNTTGEDLTITIPANYVDFLLGTSSIPASQDFDSSLVSGLTLTADEVSERLTINTGWLGDIHNQRHRAWRNSRRASTWSLPSMPI